MLNHLMFRSLYPYSFVFNAVEEHVLGIINIYHWAGCGSHSPIILLFWAYLMLLLHGFVVKQACFLLILLFFFFDSIFKIHAVWLVSCSVVSDSLQRPWTVAHRAPLSVGFSGKNTGVGCHFLLQGTFTIY